MKSGEQLDIFVDFNHDRFDIRANSEDTLKSFKDLIYTLTKVPPYRQIFLNLGHLDAIKSDKSMLKDLELTNKFVLKMRHLMREPLPSASSGTGNFSDSPTTMPRVLRSSNYKKIVGKPWLGKKLAVVDIDRTLYDKDTAAENLCGRPYLQEFLAKIYQEYDIVIWSMTGMLFLEHKLSKLGIDRHPHYKLLSYLDACSAVSVFVVGRAIEAKLLNDIWRKFPRYNKTNSIICDDRLENFYFNPKDEILVSSYFSKEYYKDDELLKLGAYLMYIADSDDLTAFDHRVWRLVVESTEASTPKTDDSEEGAPKDDLEKVGPAVDNPEGNTSEGDAPRENDEAGTVEDLALKS